MSRGAAIRALISLVAVAACGPRPEPMDPSIDPQPVEFAPSVDTGVAVAGLPPATPPAPAPIPLAERGTVVDRLPEFAFDGGWIDFEIRRDGNTVIEVARNHYAVALMMSWQFAQLDNEYPTTATTGVSLLPAASAPNGDGAPVVLAVFQVLDPRRPFRRNVEFHARWGDPRARPIAYAYRLPWPAGRTFTVLQGFHGAFSHRGSNEFAVDFDCPVATHVLAARNGVVVATNASAQGAGTTPDFTDYHRTNFVLIRHDDGTLGEYMHLAPSGVTVTPGTKVGRGDPIGLSGNTGFSTTPHLHFQVITAGDDGIAARSFPIRFASAPDRVDEPVQGQAYASWETAH